MGALELLGLLILATLICFAIFAREIVSYVKAMFTIYKAVKKIEEK